MQIKPELVDRIKDHFDLNIYETKVWLALLSKGIASAGDIAKLSRVPRSRTYDVLETLEKKGFAIEKIGKPIKYMGIKPKGILERLKNNVKKNAEEKINFLSNIKETEEFIALENLYNNGLEPSKKEDLPLSLKGKEAISQYIKEFMNKSRKELIICSDKEDIESKAKLFKKTIESLRKLKVEVKIIISGNDGSMNELEEMLGVKIQKIASTARFIIMDRMEILFYLSNKDNEEHAIIINSEFFTKAFSDILDMSLKSQ